MGWCWPGCVGEQLPSQCFGRSRVSPASNSSTKESTDSSQGSQDHILKTLRHGQSALRKLRLRISAFWLGLSLVCAGVYFWLAFGEDTFANIDFYDEGFWKMFLLQLLFEARLVFPMLAPLDDDVWFMRCVLAFEAAFFAFVCTGFLLAWWSSNDGRIGSSALGKVDDIIYLARGYAFVAYATWVMARRRTPQSLQRGLQLAVVMYSVLDALHDLTMVCLSTYLPTDLPANLIAIYVVLWPQARDSIQGRLRRWMETRGVTRAAAAIACLIGRAEPKEVLLQARQSFRSVDVSRLAFEDLCDNTPDPRLNALAEPTRLGHCDAFLSHSWHDDPAAKWEALQEWRSCFRAEHGREPRVWLDKLCIDQNNIEADLRCLPIFLSGCSSLLVLYGPTYLSRLWCIIEIFTYIMMGGSIEGIDVRLVLREDHTHEDKKAVVSAFEDFDVADCKCYDPSDKERILMVIGTAFGVLSAFNEVVAKALGQIQMGNPVLAQISTAAGDNC